MSRVLSTNNIWPNGPSCMHAGLYPNRLLCSLASRCGTFKGWRKGVRWGMNVDLRDDFFWRIVARRRIYSLVLVQPYALIFKIFRRQGIETGAVDVLWASSCFLHSSAHFCSPILSRWTMTFFPESWLLVANELSWQGNVDSLFKGPTSSFSLIFPKWHHVNYLLVVSMYLGFEPTVYLAENCNLRRIFFSYVG